MIVFKKIFIEDLSIHDNIFGGFQDHIFVYHKYGIINFCLVQYRKDRNKVLMQISNKTHFEADLWCSSHSRQKNESVYLSLSTFCSPLLFLSQVIWSS